MEFQELERSVLALALQPHLMPDRRELIISFIHAWKNLGSLNLACHRFLTAFPSVAVESYLVFFMFQIFHFPWPNFLFNPLAVLGQRIKQAFPHGFIENRLDVRRAMLVHHVLGH
jgi:hypothetical protein